MLELGMPELGLTRVPDDDVLEQISVGHPGGPGFESWPRERLRRFLLRSDKNSSKMIASSSSFALVTAKKD